MNPDDTRRYELDDDEFDALEELLTSDVVPEDCMNLEMLDGYLAAVIASPVAVTPGQWLPGVWSAHGDEAPLASGSRMQRVIGLVLRYYNELATTIGQPDGWEPFCYAGSDGEPLEVGEEWIEGFEQGLELWPEDWEAGVPEADARAVRELLDDLLAPWDDAGGQDVDEETRLQWLEAARDALGAITARWRALGLPGPEPLAVDPPPSPAAAGPGRNDPCPCGSGKKYKKCCGAA
ncbi:MAG TPA: UPF0149 family protein [Rhodocyclaceae bacterium]|nr:UPF0149 family protein [Rhodocyclaceae bacterium]